MVLCLSGIKGNVLNLRQWEFKGEVLRISATYL